MPKKIVDIAVPGNQKEKDIKNFRKKRSFHWWWILIILVVVVLGTMGVLTAQSKLEISISPRLDPLVFKDTLEVNIEAEGIDFENKVLPGKFFETEVEQWRQFQSTGISQKNGKAEGKITVFNSHSPDQVISLKATTRFLSAEGGKIFRAVDKVIIPAAGSVEITVIAQEPGEDYNIGPSKFSVPGLAGTAFYYSVYAESDSDMSGGFVEEVKMVSDEDIENAKSALVDVLLKEAKRALEVEIDKDFVVLEDGLVDEESEIDCFQEPGTIVSEFSCQGKMDAKAMAFKLPDLKELAQELAKAEISSAQNLLLETIQFSYEETRIVIEKGKMVTDVETTVKVYKDIPLEVIPGQIAKRSQSEIEKDIFDNYPQVASISFNFWPFWIRSAPGNTERIRLGLIIEP